MLASTTASTVSLQAPPPSSVCHLTLPDEPEITVDNTLDPPTGWQRDVIENGTVRFVDPKNQDCLVFIAPHASNIAPGKDESWLHSAFDTERDSVISQLKASGGIFLNEVDGPVLERIANRTYAIHGSFLMKKIIQR